MYLFQLISYDEIQLAVFPMTARKHSVITDLSSGSNRSDSGIKFGFEKNMLLCFTSCC